MIVCTLSPADNGHSDRSTDVTPPRPVAVRLPITLGQFVKAASIAATGGEAKFMVANGMVTVNGERETRRGRKLAYGDVLSVGDMRAIVAPVVTPAVEDFGWQERGSDRRGMDAEQE